MISISRTLHPTDFSENSARALSYATVLANQFHAELHLLHVNSVPLVTLAPPIAGFMPPGYQEELQKDLERELAKLVEAEDIKVVRSIAEGNVLSEILHYADEKKIELIIMGTHGRTGLKHLLIGSVAENVVRHASCPVLTIRPEQS